MQREGGGPIASEQPDPERGGQLRADSLDDIDLGVELERNAQIDFQACQSASSGATQSASPRTHHCTRELASVWSPISAASWSSSDSTDSPA